MKKVLTLMMGVLCVLTIPAVGVYPPVQEMKGQVYDTYTVYVSSWKTMNPGEGQIFTTTATIVGIDAYKGVTRVTDWDLSVVSGGSNVYTGSSTIITHGTILGKAPCTPGAHLSPKGNIVNLTDGYGAKIYGRALDLTSGWTTMYVTITGEIR